MKFKMKIFLEDQTLIQFTGLSIQHVMILLDIPTINDQKIDNVIISRDEKI